MLRSSLLASLFLLAALACGGAVRAGAVIVSESGDASVNPANVDAGVVLSPDAAIPGVSRNGWTWSNAGPQAADLHGVWGSAPDDVWFVGAAGTILHWDGHAFSAPDSGSAATLAGVWGSASGDVWAVGSNEDTTSSVLHFDGSAWSVQTTIPSSVLNAVGGSGPSDVWAVGDEGIWHFDGTAWAASPSAKPTTLRSVWASGPADAWAVGDSAGVLRWDGSAWSSASTTIEATLYSVWGTSATDVWVAGESALGSADPNGPSGYLDHWDGSAWGAPLIVAGFSSLDAVTSAIPSDAHAVGRNGTLESWNGSAWTGGELPGQYEAIWESGPSDVWAVGLGGVIAHFDGSAWTQITPPPPAIGTYEAAAVHADAPDDAWVAGNGPIGTLFTHWDGSSWTPSSIPSQSPAFLYVTRLWSSGANDVWAVGASAFESFSTPRIVHFDGTSWSDVYDGASNGEHATFHDVWGSSENDVWFVGDVGLVLHWNGTSFSFAEVGGATDPVYAVGGTGQSDVWIVGALGGNQNQFHHFDGSGWTTVFTDANGGFEVSSVFAASATNAWAAGVEGAPAYVFDGATWTYADGAATRALQDSLQIWGSSASDVWSVGEYGSVEHYDGTAWSPVALTSDTVVGVSGTGPLDAWMVTSAGALLHHP